MSTTNEKVYGALFDMDGVLVDNNPLHLKSWQVFFEKYGVSIAEEDFETKVYGKTNAEILEMLWPERTFSEEEIEALAEEKEAMYRDLVDPIFSLTPGLFNFLAQLKAEGFKTGVATNGPFSNLNYTLEKGNIRQFYDAEVTPALVALPKPAPDVYLKAAELAGISPDRVLIFEDSFTGIKAAKAAGAKVAAITTTYSREALAEVADAVFDSFEELSPAWVKALIDG